MVEDEINIFEPLVVLGTEVDEKGKDIGKKKIMKIEVPIEKDIKNLKDMTIRKRDLNKENIKVKNNEITTLKGDKDMDQNEISNLLDKKMSDMKLVETIDTIKNLTNDLKLNTENIENTMNHFNNKLKTVDTNINKKFDDISSNFKMYTNDVESNLNDVKTKNEEILTKNDEILNKQKESCVGVDCLKEKFNKISDVEKSLDDLKKKAEIALCTGKEGCGTNIPVGSSYCPGCGKSIKSWNGLMDWKPYEKRNK